MHPKAKLNANYSFDEWQKRIVALPCALLLGCRWSVSILLVSLESQTKTKICYSDQILTVSEGRASHISMDYWPLSIAQLNVSHDYFLLESLHWLSLKNLNKNGPNVGILHISVFKVCSESLTCCRGHSRCINCLRFWVYIYLSYYVQDVGKHQIWNDFSHSWTCQYCSKEQPLFTYLFVFS